MEVLSGISNIERDRLFEKYQTKFDMDKSLNRKVVSFQANKTNPIYRWFKYKEGFSSNLVEYYINKFNAQGKVVLDPFAGTGTTLFASSKYSCRSIGIELLPVGIFFMQVREILPLIQVTELKKLQKDLWKKVYKQPEKEVLKHISITAGAFPDDTEILLNKYMSYCDSLKKEYSIILRFIAFSILESISYTRKDGQYLRWDYRSNRTSGKSKFDKGTILTFEDAIDSKFNEILEDLNDESKVQGELFRDEEIDLPEGEITIYQDTCLKRMSLLENESIDLIITSPPYCNRYDYTRTYALELVFLGCDNEKVKELRQSMLSCTVENKSKSAELESYYKSIGNEKAFSFIKKVFDECKAMQEVIGFLQYFKSRNELNNNGIARMVENYFFEMCFTIYEMSRVLKKGGKVIMVNDNVRYNGEEIPVDLILSEFAEGFNLVTENIFVLDQKKGNSSQQMGSHGRTPIRKCVYLWEKK